MGTCDYDHDRSYMYVHVRSTHIQDRWWQHSRAEECDTAVMWMHCVVLHQSSHRQKQPSTISRQHAKDNMRTTASAAQEFVL